MTLLSSIFARIAEMFWLISSASRCDCCCWKLFMCLLLTMGTIGQRFLWPAQKKSYSGSILTPNYPRSGLYIPHRWRNDRRLQVILMNFEMRFRLYSSYCTHFYELKIYFWYSRDVLMAYMEIMAQRKLEVSNSNNTGGGSLRWGEGLCLSLRAHRIFLVYSGLQWDPSTVTRTSPDCVAYYRLFVFQI